MLATIQRHSDPSWIVATIDPLPGDEGTSRSHAPFLDLHERTCRWRPPQPAAEGTKGRSWCAIGIAITVGPSAPRAVVNASLISSVVSDCTAMQPKPFAVDTISKPGRSSAGTFGVFSNTANSFRMAYSALHGTM